MSAITAMLRRDLLIWLSYRTAVLAQVGSIFTILVLIYFVSHFMGSDPSRFGGQAADYFSFLLAGYVFGEVFSQTFLGFQESLRESQVNGTLEPLLLSRIRISTLILGSSVFRVALTLVRCTVYVGVAVVVFGYWHHANVPGVLLVLIVASVPCALYGVLAAAFVLKIKRGEPAVAAFIGANWILGGVLFPTTLLPTWVQPLAMALPFTEGLAGVRQALQGASLGTLVMPLMVLAGTCLVVGPLALMGFRLALRQAKLEGSLVQY